MSQEREPFNRVRVVPLRPPATPEAPGEEHQPAADPSAEAAPGFSTTSLELASYLLTRGYQIRTIVGPKHRRRVIFDSVPEPAVLAFYNGGPAPARTLFEVFHTLKHAVVTTLAPPRQGRILPPPTPGEGKP